MEPILIAVGIGNTSIHVGQAHAAVWPPRWLQTFELPTRSFAPNQLAPHLAPGPCRWRVASVHRASEAQLAAWVTQERARDDYRLLACRDLSLHVDLHHPERVGMDRLVAAVAARRLAQPHRPTIVVDAGTAITVDLVTSAGAFCGGVILPGMQMVSRALARETDLLPEVVWQCDQQPAVVGKSTEEAIRSGLYWGAVGAVRELIERMSAELGDTPQVFVTGGDARKLATHLGSHARFVDDLVLAGILATDAEMAKNS